MVYINGMPRNVEANSDGTVDVEQVRKAGQIPPGRVVVAQEPTGKNVLMPRRGYLRPGSSIQDFPESERGAA